MSSSASQLQSNKVSQHVNAHLTQAEKRTLQLRQIRNQWITEMGKHHSDLIN